MSFFMEQDDALNSRMAECFTTIKGNRYSMMNAKNFEAKANVETKEVPMLGRNIKGRKVLGIEIKIKMTVYKCSEMFDDLIEEYKNTGVMPTFDIQVTSEDKTSTTGRSTKIYRDCVIDGDVLLGMFDTAGDFIEQEINAYAMDYSSPEKYKTPSYM